MLRRLTVNWSSFSLPISKCLRGFTSSLQMLRPFWLNLNKPAQGGLTWLSYWPLMLGIHSGYGRQGKSNTHPKRRQLIWIWDLSRLDSKTWLSMELEVGDRLNSILMALRPIETWILRRITMNHSLLSWVRREGRYEEHRHQGLVWPICRIFIWKHLPVNRNSVGMISMTIR